MALSVPKNREADLADDQHWSRDAHRIQFVYESWLSMGEPTVEQIRNVQHPQPSEPLPTTGPTAGSPPPHQSFDLEEDLEEEENMEELDEDEDEADIESSELQEIDNKISDIDEAVQVLQKSIKELGGKGSVVSDMEALVSKQANVRAALEAKKKKLLESSTVPRYSPFTQAKQAKMKGTVDKCIAIIRKFASEENLDPLACFQFFISSGKMRKGSAWDAFQRLKSYERASMLFKSLLQGVSSIYSS